MERVEGYYWILPKRTTIGEVAWWGTYDPNDLNKECWHTTDGELMNDSDLISISTIRLIDPFL